MRGRTLLALLCAGVLSGCARAGFRLAVDASPVDAHAERGGHDGSNDRDGPLAGTRWVAISSGTFSMGSPAAEPCREEGLAKLETQHTVKLTRRFEISATEVTQAQFAALMGYNPSELRGCGDDCPVERVSWHEAAAYCTALSRSKGLESCYVCSGSAEQTRCAPTTSKTIFECLGYRLPVEAEWELACRAGTTTAYYSGNNNGNACDGCLANDGTAAAIGWYADNAAVTYSGCGKTVGLGCPDCAGAHPVGKKQPNAWGLFDLAGNVWEWCHDWYQAELGTADQTDPSGPSTGSSRSARGGAWNSGAKTLRSANRGYWVPDGRLNFMGVRCVRTLP